MRGNLSLVKILCADSFYPVFFLFLPMVNIAVIIIAAEWILVLSAKASSTEKYTWDIRK